MIRVLIICGTMNVGGIENQLMHLLRNADKSSFQIDFTTTIDHPFYEDEIYSLGGHCFKIPPTNGKHFLRYMRSIYWIMKEGNYDIVHSHELFHSGIVLLVARLAGVKHRFVHAHNWSDGNGLFGRTNVIRTIYNHAMRRLILSNGTDFIACSTLAGEYLYGKKATKQSNYHLVFNSVDTSKYLNRYGITESGDYMEDGVINLIQVGRYTEVKNQIFTIKIAEELRRRGLQFRILSVGDDDTPYGHLVRNEIERKNLQNYMVLLGIRKDIDVLMRKASVFLLPSKYEGMPLVLIEAQASGLHCICADTFSREVDFGLDTITWLPETADETLWVDAIEDAVYAQKPTKAAVQSTIMKKGFDSKYFAQKLCDLYTRSIGHG